MGSFPSRRAADWCVCTMSLYIGASRRLIGTRAPTVYIGTSRAMS